MCGQPCRQCVVNVRVLCGGRGGVSLTSGARFCVGVGAGVCAKRMGSTLLDLQAIGLFSAHWCSCISVHNEVRPLAPVLSR